VAVNPRADFGKVQRVAVVTFSGPQGDVAADLLAQRLLALGADVVERQQLAAILRERNLAQSGILDAASVKKVGKVLGVDALFVGTVARSKESRSYMVTNARHNKLTQVTAVDGRTVVPSGSVAGVPNSQIVTTEASASVIARMVDARTGSILWSATMSDEGFDSADTIDEIMESFAASLAKVWPQAPQGGKK
jgi:TolB-like protein